ncbi:MAG: type I DNA topoisomerase [Candidatus Rokubacteria bacterium]|nr:type I DNA topoisomerase [Candidatus Rokubacteria bacterium]
MPVAKRSLVVVESPTKVKTIQKYLDSTYIVKASMGHVRDLPKSRLGVDVKKGFKPEYRILPAKRRVLDELKKAAERAEALYVATDPDREGEAIGWHLAQELPVNGRKVYRVMFNEITARAIKAAFKSPGRIDQRKVDAQQARRVLDRLVGYNLSPLLWKKVQRGLSAGRVQSVAVRVVADREREIQAFVSVEYWSLHARLRGQNPPEFVATLKEVRGEKADLPSEAAVQVVVAALGGKRWIVKAVNRGERKRNPAPPFITSTLQQEAGRKLHFSPKKTMLLAQQLYEGIEVGAEGPIGLITYMRTDSVRVSEEAQAEARRWVSGRLGAEYLPASPPGYRSKKGAEDAHEAIRPSDVSKEPKALARSLTRDQLALYRLIWERFLASQMLPAIYDTVTVDIKADDCLFRAQGSTLRFPGFMAVYVESRAEPEAVPEDEAEAVVPSLAVGEALTLLGLDPKQHFTQPPSRYTEASLVKLLEDRGIGRPSTYAQIMSTIQERGYVRREKGTLYPTELGLHVTDFLVPLFPGIMDVEFTAQLEETLDKIEEGEASWTTTIQRFYKRFEKELREAGKQEPGATGQACPQCGSPLLERWGRYGRFLACSGYPDCKYTQDLNGNGRGRNAEVIPGEVCEQCGKPMVLKDGRYGKFIACQGYPECKNTKPLTLGIPCPEGGCGGQLVERRSRRGKVYYACSNYPRCKFILWQRPIPEPCPKCGVPLLVERYTRGKKLLRHCFRDGCDYKQETEASPA